MPSGRGFRKMLPRQATVIVLMALVLVPTSLAAPATLVVTPTSVDDYRVSFRCMFWLPGDKPGDDKLVLQADDDTVPTQQALIGINGEKLMLPGKGLKVWNKKKGHLNLGDMLIVRFGNEAASVTLRAKVTWLCPVDSEGCEVTRYRARITVAKGALSTTLNAVGECGS